MKLLYTKASPFARKARATIIELGLEAQVEWVEITQLTIPTHFIAEISRENPLGKVPTLILDNGRKIADSIVIAEYFDTLAGGRLFPKDESRWTALTLQALADGIMEAGVACRLEGVRPEAIRWEDWVVAHRRKITAALDAIDGSPDFLRGEFNIGQLAFVCAVEWIAFRDVYHDTRVGRPRLAAWLDAAPTRPSLVATRP